MVHAESHILRAGGSSIFNLSSITKIELFPCAGVYCMSKAAIQMILQVIAMEAALFFTSRLSLWIIGVMLSVDSDSHIATNIPVNV